MNWYLYWKKYNKCIKLRQSYTDPQSEDISKTSKKKQPLLKWSFNKMEMYM